MDIDNQLKTLYLNSIYAVANLKETWRFLHKIDTALSNLEKVNEINLKLFKSSGFELIAEEKKERLLQVLIEFLNNSYEYIKQNISKQNLIIDRDEFLDATGKYPGK